MFITIQYSIKDLSLLLLHRDFKICLCKYEEKKKDQQRYCKDQYLTDRPHTSPPPKAGVVLSKLKGQPLSIHFIRWRGEDGSIYQPLVKHLRKLKQEKPSLRFGPKPSSQQDRTAGQKRGQTQCMKDGRYSQ